MAEWEKVVGRLERQKARTDRGQRRYYLQLMQHTAEAAVDGQGRITLPPVLMELADLQAEVTFVGAGDVIEMWNPERYTEYVGGGEKDFDDWLVQFL